MTVDAYQLRAAAGLPTGAIRLPRVLTADEATVFEFTWNRRTRTRAFSDILRRRFRPWLGKT